MDDPRKRSVAAGYDRLAERYLAWGQAIRGDPRERMLERFADGLVDGARVLELGCGAGVPSTRWLAGRFEVVGIDISARQIDLARGNVPEAAFIHGDFTDHRFADGSFDGVVALYAISHAPRDVHARLFADIHRWLAPGGRFLATLGATDAPDWTGDWLGEPMFFSSHDAEENRRLLRATGFELRTNEIVAIREPEGDVSFLWIIAEKPRRLEQTP